MTTGDVDVEAGVGAGALSDVVTVIDRLVGPGGCPWDREQTHVSLAPYLIEEAYEVVDAIESASGDPASADAHLAEELGDVLLQVVFHARVAAARSAFDIDDVARGLVAKLVRRHPHVFDTPGAATATTADVASRWEDLKAMEQPDRGLFDGIPAGLPALARAGKVVARLDRAGLDAAALAAATSLPPAHQADPADPADPTDTAAQALFSVVVASRRDGVDAESALRRLLSRIEHAAVTLRPIAHPAGDNSPPSGAAASG